MKIKGNTVGTPMPRSDLRQTDPKKADYIKGRELIMEHIAAKGNVHGLTAGDIGLGNVDNTSDMDKPVSTAQENAIAEARTEAQNNLNAHAANKQNPHETTAQQVGADPAGTAESKVGTHNVDAAAHADLRLLVSDLTSRLNTLANSDDETLDQMSEVVAYIKSNRELIAAITTDKVSVADIIDNLVTNVSGKPLSAAQGVVLKGLIDALSSEKLSLSGGTMTGNLNMGGNKITGMGEPTDSTDAATKAYTDGVILKVYPVGAIYISYNSTSPASLFGGTWTQIQGRFLLASSSSYAAGSTGGAATVTLTTNQMPSHTHTLLNNNAYNVAGPNVAAAGFTLGVSAANSLALINSTGGGAAHNNMPPYLAVYMWRRTA